jgi:hypothetical protein
MAEITISALAENIFAAKDRIAKEPTGFLQSVIVNSDASDGVSINGTVTSFVTAQPTLNTSYTPSMTIPEGDAQTVGVKTMQIAQTGNVKIPLTGELARQLENTAGRDRVVTDMFAQAFRKIRNGIESHVGSVIAAGASRGYGTAGTSPFATDHKPINYARKILIDNGAPDDGENSLVIDTLAGTDLRNISNLYKVNEGGSTDLLRRGTLLDISGIMIKESSGVAATTAGAMTGALFNGAGAVGDTTITFDTGTVNTTGIVAGDIVSITGATGGAQKYVVATGTTSTSGTFTIAAPGLRAVVADNTAITVSATSTRNVLFNRNAVELVMRPPAQPYGKDAAVDRMTFVDEGTGLVFEVAHYVGYGKAMFDITTFYQAKVWKPEFCAVLLG